MSILYMLHHIVLMDYSEYAAIVGGAKFERIIE